MLKRIITAPKVITLAELAISMGSRMRALRFEGDGGEQVVEEVASIPNNRLFFVDNSLAQDKQWELELFKALKPLKRSIISHPVQDDDEVLDAAVDALLEGRGEPHLIEAARRVLRAGGALLVAEVERFLRDQD